MKERLRLTAFFLLVLTLFSGTRLTFAGENRAPGLQVERGEYGSNIVEYIQKNWENFFGEEELAAYRDASIIVGEPYGIYSRDAEKMIATKFPIYADGRRAVNMDCNY